MKFGIKSGIKPGINSGIKLTIKSRFKSGIKSGIQPRSESTIRFGINIFKERCQSVTYDAKDANSRASENT